MHARRVGVKPCAAECERLREEPALECGSEAPRRMVRGEAAAFPWRGNPPAEKAVAALPHSKTQSFALPQPIIKEEETCARSAGGSF